MNNKHPKEIKIRLDPRVNQDAPNLDGVRGRKCNNCGGYGFTMNIKGGKLDCNDCEKTGVANPTNREIQNQLSDLKADMQALKKAIIKTLVGKGEDLDAKEVRRNINV